MLCGHARVAQGNQKGPEGPALGFLVVCVVGGKSIDYPQDTDVTFKKAQRVRYDPSEKQKILPMEGESPEQDD